MSCKWDGPNRPRLIPNRHRDDCTGETCPGCQPCTKPHCRLCSVAHHDGTCPECMAATRADLHEIGTHCDALPDEVEHRGIHGEAMMLLGPAADPEARGHLEASIRCGRVPADYLDHADHERHPLFVLGTWLMVWQDALDHDEEQPTVTIAHAIDYLDRQMTYMGGFAHVPFEDFARDLRQCTAHLRAVLHDQNQGDRAGVGCFQCGRDLERLLGKQGFDDHWTCQGCHRRYTVAEYNFALRAALEASA